MQTPCRTRTCGDTTRPTCWIWPSHSLCDGEFGGVGWPSLSGDRPEIDEADGLEARGLHVVALADARGLGVELLAELVQPLLPVALVGLDLLALALVEQRQLVGVLLLLRLRLLDARALRLENRRASRRASFSPRRASLPGRVVRSAASAWVFRCGRSSSRSRGAPDASRCLNLRRTRPSPPAALSAFSSSSSVFSSVSSAYGFERRPCGCSTSIQRAATARISSCRREARSP